MYSLKFAKTEKTNRYTGQKCVEPTIVIDYNQNMGGVDVGDQILSKFHTLRRCKKAYMKIFFYLIDLLLLNSYVIFKNHKKDRAFHIFKQQLAGEIIGEYLLNIKVSEASNDSITRYTGKHFPIRIRPTPAKGSRTPKRCVACLSKRTRRETVFKCHILNARIPREII